MSLHALTFRITFFTAQFRKHYIKLFRDTYLMPLPSSIAGMIGAIIGIEKYELKKFAEKVDLLCGAELLSFNGYIYEYTRIFKFSREKISKIVEKLRTPEQAREMMPIYKSISLYNPEYKIAVALNNQKIYSEITDRLRKKDFVYEIYGGNDYNFVKDIKGIREAKVIKTNEGRGYILRKDFQDMRPVKKAIISIDRVIAEVRDLVLFVYSGDILAKEKLSAVDDGESIIFVHPASPYIVREIL